MGGGGRRGIGGKTNLAVMVRMWRDILVHGGVAYDGRSLLGGRGGGGLGQTLAQEQTPAPPCESGRTDCMSGCARGDECVTWTSGTKPSQT